MGLFGRAYYRKDFCVWDLGGLFSGGLILSIIYLFIYLLIYLFIYLFSFFFSLFFNGEGGGGALIIGILRYMTSSVFCCLKHSPLLRKKCDDRKVCEHQGRWIEANKAGEINSRATRLCGNEARHHFCVPKIYQEVRNTGKIQQGWIQQLNPSSTATKEEPECSVQRTRNVTLNLPKM